MKRITLVAGVLGLGLTVWMLSRFGAQAIFALVMTGGWGILAAIVFIAFRSLFPRRRGALSRGVTLLPICPCGIFHAPLCA